MREPPLLSQPSADLRDCVVLFGHAAYQFSEPFARRKTGMRPIEVHTVDELKARCAEADFVVASGLWRNEMLDVVTRLRFVQSISAGTDNFDKQRFRDRGVRLASAQGVNAQAVSEHAMALMLALARQIHIGRDNQRNRHWRGMIGDVSRREFVLGGKTLLIVGLGDIGQRLARLAKAFGMRVVATRRDPSRGAGAADAVYDDGRLAEIVGEADIVALTCPLTPETANLIDADILGRMRRTAYLVNVARGKVVDEAALVAALEAGVIAGAALDVAREEPLPASSALWSLPNVLITPHTAGESRIYEEEVIDLFLDNAGRLARGEAVLRNQIV